MLLKATTYLDELLLNFLKAYGKPRRYNGSQILEGTINSTPSHNRSLERENKCKSFALEV